MPGVLNRYVIPFEKITVLKFGIKDWCNEANNVVLNPELFNTARIIQSINKTLKGKACY